MTEGQISVETCWISPLTGVLTDTLLRLAGRLGRGARAVLLADRGGAPHRLLLVVELILRNHVRLPAFQLARIAVRCMESLHKVQAGQSHSVTPHTHAKLKLP